jgi:hypothetical protein
MAGGFFDLSSGETVRQVSGRIVIQLRDIMLDVVKFDVFRAGVVLTDPPWSLSAAAAGDTVSTWNDLVHFQKIHAGVVQARDQADSAFVNYDFQTFAKRLYGPR